MPRGKRKYRVITFDGGGIKGLISAVILKRLVAETPNLIEKTELLAGTSTGGLIALCLASGKSPEDIVKLYEEEGKGIFSKSFFRFGAFGAKYKNKYLRELLVRLFPEKKLGDIEKKVLVPTFDLDTEANDEGRTWKPKFFDNFSGSHDNDRLVADVLTYTTAAPVYFPTVDGFVDGGVISNNPSMAAFTKVLKEKIRGVKRDNVVLLSLGTGRTYDYIAERNMHWGGAKWAVPLLSILFEGANEVSHYQCQQLLGSRYCRVNPVVKKVDGIGMDSVKKIKKMVEIAENYDLSVIQAWIKENW